MMLTVGVGLSNGGTVAEASRTHPAPAISSSVSGETIVVFADANEGSALLAITNSNVLTKKGWDLAFWTVLDEKRVEDNIAIIARTQKDNKWEIQRIKVKDKVIEATDDSEALCRKDDYVYIIGSHFGKKDGILRDRRQFIARFKESVVLADSNLNISKLEVCIDEFRLHRSINDALKKYNIPLDKHSEQVKTKINKLINETRQRYKNKKWVERIKADDWPINIEGAAFLESGSLLLGLRYPVTENGSPILIRIEDIDVMFQNKDVKISGVWTLEGVGSKRELTGIRALERVGDSIHAITGNIDSRPAQSALLKIHHPYGFNAKSAHYVFTIPKVNEQQIHPQLKRRFESNNVEGIASVDGQFFYVRDELESLVIFQ